MASSIPQTVRERIFQQRVAVDNTDVDTLALQQDRITAAVAAAQTQAAAAMAKANLATSTASTTAGQVISLQALAANVQSLSDASVADRLALHAQLDALANRVLTGQVAQATLNAVLVNGSGSLSFTWPIAWTDTNYVPLLVTPGVGVNTVAYTKTTTTCAVTFKATAISLGTLFSLVGYRVG